LKLGKTSKTHPKTGPTNFRNIQKLSKTKNKKISPKTKQSGKIQRNTSPKVPKSKSLQIIPQKTNHSKKNNSKKKKSF